VGFYYNSELLSESSIIEEGFSYPDTAPAIFYTECRNILDSYREKLGKIERLGSFRKSLGLYKDQKEFKRRFESLFDKLDKAKASNKKKLSMFVFSCPETLTISFLNSLIASPSGWKKAKKSKKFFKRIKDSFTKHNYIYYKDLDTNCMMLMLIDLTQDIMNGVTVATNLSLYFYCVDKSSNTMKELNLESALSESSMFSNVKLL